VLYLAEVTSAGWCWKDVSVMSPDRSIGHDIQFWIRDVDCKSLFMATQQTTTNIIIIIIIIIEKEGQKELRYRDVM